MQCNIVLLGYVRLYLNIPIFKILYDFFFFKIMSHDHSQAKFLNSVSNRILIGCSKTKRLLPFEVFSLH